MDRILSLAFAGCLLAADYAPAQSPPDAGAQLEFFEKHVRPLFVRHCYQCHGDKKQESGLALNSSARIRRGGDRGTAIVAGDPDASLLLQAVRYADDDLQMPPRGKLTEEQVTALSTWIKNGAVLPTNEPLTTNASVSTNDFNLIERRQYWSYQPIAVAALPGISGTSWCQVPIDRFILAAQEAAGLESSPQAAKRTLIRRLTFDLIGLPPTPADVAAFLADDRPDAYERLVDRLLASPHYGERWGRHWLDVVRYSETLGFEFDYDLHNAWRYRDYIIRAFNDDLPYNQFVIEHLAGDLIAPPRRHPLDDTNESILATGFWWMVEGKQTPVDIRKDQADRIDNQLDVLGKAFLGQTIACARCHDHKFDAISTRDYYALAGYLTSSRFQQAFIDNPAPVQKQIEAVANHRATIKSQVATRASQIWHAQSQKISQYLLAAAELSENSGSKGSEPDHHRKPPSEPLIPPDVEALAQSRGLSPQRLGQWVKALADESLSSADHPLHVWSLTKKKQPASVETAAATLSAADRAVHERRAAASTFADFRHGDYSGWFIAGPAFDGRPTPTGEIVIGAIGTRPIARLSTGGADSGLLTLRVQGEMRSPSFTLDKDFVHIRLAGRHARVNLIIDGYTLIMNPMYGKLTVNPDSDHLVWRTIPVDRWLGHRAYLEFSDSTIPPHGLSPPPSTARTPAGPDGYLTVREIVVSNDREPPATPGELSQKILSLAKEPSKTSLADAIQRAVINVIDRWQRSLSTGSQMSDDDIACLNWLLENGLLDDTGDESTNLNALQPLIDRYAELASRIPAPQRAPTLADGTGEDECVFLRGNYRTPGDLAPRALPQVIESNKAAPAGPTSGRLQLAQRLVSPQNSLLPRVIVNRLWQHHFAAGLVRTPDDFGRMGQAPSHPELLDYLAGELIRGNWSLKRIQRSLVTSATYRQSSSPPPSDAPSVVSKPSSSDPDNRLLTRMPIRRLEAEAIRDAMLAVSGRLDETLHGPSVLPYLTPYMEGRGKPQTGPLDGAGRRSLYINARRNFLTPLLLAFDYPVTFTPIGRRGSATIPSQALALMNDPFVVGEASRWAEHTLTQRPMNPERRITSLYEAAYCRPPTAEELTDAIDFLQAQSLRYASGSEDPRVWVDLCHVLINVKEFIFVE